MRPLVLILALSVAMLGSRGKKKDKSIDWPRGSPSLTFFCTERSAVSDRYHCEHIATYLTERGAIVSMVPPEPGGYELKVDVEENRSSQGRCYNNFYYSLRIRHTTGYNELYVMPDMFLMACHQTILLIRREFVPLQLKQILKCVLEAEKYILSIEERLEREAHDKIMASSQSTEQVDPEK